MDNLRGVLCLVGVTALCACGPADDSYYDDADLEFRSDDGGVLNPGGRPGSGGWIGNGLEDPDVSGVDPGYSLASAAGLSDEMGLLDDLDRLGTAEYLVECALPWGTSITKQVNGEAVVLEGLLGLAPEWETGECDQDCQQWVSACLLARTNVSGEMVQIWMKAEHDAIGWEAPPGALFEAGFYGNLFEDPEGQYYCKGDHEGIVEARREGRTCTSHGGEACDFIKLSKCSKPARCEQTGPNGDVPADCRAPGADRFHTIATYIVP